MVIITKRGISKTEEKKRGIFVGPKTEEFKTEELFNGATKTEEFYLLRDQNRGIYLKTKEFQRTKEF